MRMLKLNVVFRILLRYTLYIQYLTNAIMVLNSFFLVIPVEVKTDNWKSVAEYKLNVNQILEKIFLLTLEKGKMLFITTAV